MAIVMLCNSLERAFTVDDLRRLARRRLPAPVFNYLDGGADDESSLRRNRDAFLQLQLVPRYLVDVSRLDTTARVLGQQIDWPVILAPTGMSRLFHHDGELAACRAAAAAGTLYCASTMASIDMERIARATEAAKCFQLYAFRDRGLTREFLSRARQAGYKALCLTVDVPVAGNRLRDRRSGMILPPRLRFMGVAQILSRPRWCWNLATSPALVLANVAHRIAAGSSSATSLMSYINSQFDASITWDDVTWIRDEWPGPFAIKGLLSVDDAKRAAQLGATAVVISNHGGRQLDGTPAPLEVLPRVADAVGDRVEIILDGGVRRGTDVLKAIALGARACMIGRSYLYGLAAGGEAGVTRALTILRGDIERAMALLGACRLDELRAGHFVSNVTNDERTG